MQLNLFLIAQLTTSDTLGWFVTMLVIGMGLFVIATSVFSIMEFIAHRRRQRAQEAPEFLPSDETKKMKNKLKKHRVKLGTLLKWMERFDTRFSDVEQRFDKLDYTLSGMERHLDTLDQRVAKTETVMTNIVVELQHMKDGWDKRFSRLERMLAATDERLAVMEKSLSIVVDKTNSMDTRLIEVDHRLTDVDQQLTTFDIQITFMEQRLATVGERLQGLEDRSATFEQKNNQHFDLLEVKVDLMEQRFGFLEQRAHVVENKLGAVEQSLQRMSGSVSQLVISNNNLNMAMNIMAPGSAPVLVVEDVLQLSDVGRTIFKVSGANKYVDEHRDDLMRRMESKTLLTGLDVQNEAYLVLNERSSSRGFADIRTYVYENPLYYHSDGSKTPVLLATVIQVMAIYLRDVYMERHPFVISRPAA